MSILSCLAAKNQYTIYYSRVSVFVAKLVSLIHLRGCRRVSRVR